uniref:Bifunctional inhibitor/plant lipid transfer protein/seed storage helical domain-containing protein n=1 Tax=Aegilops tauschii subsp. strangulata TaxID=200361 RepID=A0A453I6Y9_AEGTS
SDPPRGTPLFRRGASACSRCFCARRRAVARPCGQDDAQAGPVRGGDAEPQAKVTPGCCAQIRSIGRSPKCLCAVMPSSTARQAGVKHAIAMTIPKRCAIANRPIGYKYGRKFISSELLMLGRFLCSNSVPWSHRHLLCSAFVVQHTPCHEEQRHHPPLRCLPTSSLKSQQQRWC